MFTDAREEFVQPEIIAKATNLTDVTEPSKSTIATSSTVIERVAKEKLLREESQSTGPTTDSWTIFGRRAQRSKVQYFAQVIILYVLIFTCLINITLGDRNLNLWSTLLASSIGYLLPSPQLKDKRK